MTALAVVGVGNPLAGDDGVGISVVQRLRPDWEGHPSLLLMTLEGDPLEIADHLGRAPRFLFVDAVVAEPPGQLLIPVPVTPSPAPSPHQIQIATVMATLEALEHADPFPDWEIWGIAIRLPQMAGTCLSPPVEAGAEAMVGRLQHHLTSCLPESLDT